MRSNRHGVSDEVCLCDEHYVGETSRKLRERTAEHHFQARNRKSETAWGEHMKQVHPRATIVKAPIKKKKKRTHRDLEERRDQEVSRSGRNSRQTTNNKPQPRLVTNVILRIVEHHRRSPPACPRIETRRCSKHCLHLCSVKRNWNSTRSSKL